MKLVTKLFLITTLASFMFAGINLTWGNTYVDGGIDFGSDGAEGCEDIDNGGDGDGECDDPTAEDTVLTGMQSHGSFGVHFDVNDNTTVGWENGLMIGLAGPAGSTFRLGYGDAPTLGMAYTWWEGGGTGWGTNLSTAVDFDLTDGNDFAITINLGFGF